MKQPFSKSLRELWDVFFGAFLSQNIVLVQAIGLSPIIAIGVNLKYGVTLAVCTALVLLPASLFMSLLGDRLPPWSRAPLYTGGRGGHPARGGGGDRPVHLSRAVRRAVSFPSPDGGEHAGFLPGGRLLRQP